MEIKSILKELNNRPRQNIVQRLDFISSKWLEKPYLLYCLGEGKHGDFDQNPIYRTDGFDCETLVDTTLALANANSLAAFKKHIKRIRYHDEMVDFTHRNHFTNIDWNRSNQKQSYVKDITRTINYNNRPIAVKNRIVINKSQWYAHMSESRIHMKPQQQHLKQTKLQQLRAKSKLEGSTVSNLYYLPISHLYDKNERPIEAIFSQIPNGTIIEIVTPESHTTEKVGTELDISHMGFAFYKHHTLYFRNASMLHKKVVNEPLADYLKRYLHSPTIKGIHLEQPLERQE